MEIEEQLLQSVTLFINKKYFKPFYQIINKIDILPMHSNTYSTSLFNFKEDSIKQKNNLWTVFINKAFEKDSTNHSAVINKYLTNKAQIILKQLSDMKIFILYQYDNILSLYLLLCEMEILKKSGNMIKYAKFLQNKNDLLKRLEKIKQEKDNKEKFGSKEESKHNYVESLIQKIKEGVKSGDDYLKELKYQERKLLLLKKIKSKNNNLFNQSVSISKSRTIEHTERKSYFNSILNKEKTKNVLKYNRFSSTHQSSKILLRQPIKRATSMKTIPYNNNRVVLNYLSKKVLYY